MILYLGLLSLDSNIPTLQYSNAVKYALIGSAWNDGSDEVNGSRRTRDENRKYVKRSNKAVYYVVPSLLQFSLMFVVLLILLICRLPFARPWIPIVQNESGSNYLRDKFHHETCNANDG